MCQKKLITKLSIVKLNFNDLNSCIDLDQLTLNGIWNKEQWKIELSDPKRICIGLIKNEKLIGFSCGWIVLDEIHITIFAIHPCYQGKGLGRFLFSSFLNIIKYKKIQTVRLEVKGSNVTAIKFYQRLGFKKVAHRANLYQDGSDGLIYELKIRH